jgi:dTDP-4-dehydrorhamnose reductase
VRVLLTGGSGQIGGELQRAAPKNWSIFAPDLDEFDYCNPSSVMSVVQREAWDLIVNTAAHTAVDRAESDAAAVWQINAVGVAGLARLAALESIPFIQISTDYVFDGAKPEPYTEDDPVSPLGVYGSSKAAGEIAVLAAGGPALILRTAWLVSAIGNNFVKTMLRLSGEGRKLRVVNDQYGCPTSATDVAGAIIHIAPSFLERRDTAQIYHLVNSGSANWHDVAVQIFQSSTAFGLTAPDVESIPAREYPTAARRPANSRLSTEKIRRDYGVTMRHWREAIDEVVRQLLSTNAGGTR